MEKEITKSDVEIAVIYVNLEKGFCMSTPELNKAKSNLVKVVRESVGKKEYKKLPFDTYMPFPVQLAYLKFSKVFEDYTGEAIEI